MKLRTKIAQNPPGRGKRNLSKFAKKVCSMVLAAGLLLASSSITSWAALVTVDGVKYYLSGSEASVYGLQDKNLSGNITIRSSVSNGGTTYPVKELDNGAFDYCDGITSVTIPDSVTKVGDCLYCTSLKTVSIGSGVSTLETAFSGLPSLETINVSSNNSTYSSDDGILYNKDKTTLLRYPSAKSGTSFTVPSSVRSIDYAFSGSKYLTSVNIPSGVNDIHIWGFIDCSVLNAINVDENNSSYSSVDGVLFNKYKTTLISYPCGKSGETYSIPSSVGYITSRAFYKNTYLTSVTLPSHVTELGDYVFKGCTNLTNLTIPSSVVAIGKYVCEGCSNLTSVTIPKGVTTVGNYGFNECSSLRDVFVEDGCGWDVSNYSSAKIRDEANIWRWSEAQDQTGAPAGKTLVDVTSKYRGSSGDSLACSALGDSFTISSVPSGCTLTHSYGEPTYTWSLDNNTCTAAITCSDCGNVGSSQTVDTTNEVTTAATCTADGVRTYTATFSSPFSTQTKDVTIDALGHDYGTPTYTWVKENGEWKLTAERICTRDSSHKESETLNSTGTVQIAPTCTTAGTTRYTPIGSFTNSAFSTAGQYRDEVDLDALGHIWGDPSYVWLDNFKKCRGKRVCARDASHTETVTVDTVCHEDPAPTHYVSGEGVFTADFSEYFGGGTVAVSPVVELLPEAFYSVDVYWNGDMKFVFDGGRFDTATESIVSSFESTDDIASMGEKDAAAGAINKWYGFDGGRNRVVVVNRSNKDIKAKYEVSDNRQTSGICLELYDYAANNSTGGYQLNLNGENLNLDNDTDRFGSGNQLTSSNNNNEKTIKAAVSETQVYGNKIFFNITGYPGNDFSSSSSSPETIGAITITFSKA